MVLTNDLNLLTSLRRHFLFFVFVSIMKLEQEVRQVFEGSVHVLSLVFMCWTSAFIDLLVGHTRLINPLPVYVDKTLLRRPFSRVNGDQVLGPE